jgi:predicted Zn-dependent protease
MRLRIPLLLPLLLLLAACSTVPGTGRSRVEWVSLSDEISLGEQAYAETMSQANIVTSGSDAAMVRRIGERVAAAAKELYPDPAAEFEFEVVLIDEPQTANAWCLPGGKMAVYTGLLPVTQDENSLAVVMGHEVAHAVASHGAERMTHNMITGFFLDAGSIVVADMPSEQRDTLMAAFGLGAQYGVMLPFSRTHESEADELGLYLAAKAGYDPRASVGLWERMASMGGNRPPQWLSTHPSESTRIAHLQELMPEAMRIYRESGY